MRSVVLAVAILTLSACGASPSAEPVAPAAPAQTAATATTGPGTPPVTTPMHGDTMPPAPSSIAPVPPGIRCTAYYRPLGDTSTEGAVEQSLAIDAGVARSGAMSDIQFPTMGFRAEWLAEDQSVVLTVTASDGTQLSSVLYQAAGVDLPAIQFVGGHGFTGLHYVDHEGAQLQFWCSAE